MRNSRSYQMVSEHSILSARRENEVAATEEFLEKLALHRKTEWKAEVDKIKQRLERRKRRCDDELSEKEFEIYLEMKLHWLQEYYVTAKSRKPEKKIEEPEERRDRSREILEKMLENLESCLSKLAVISRKPDEEGNPELEDVKPETDESKVAKSEVTKEDEASLEELTTETSDGDATAAEMCVSHNLRKQVLTSTIAGCHSQIGDEEDAKLDEKTPEKPSETTLTEEPPPEPPEPPDCGLFNGGSKSLVVVKQEGDVTESSTTATGNGTTATKVPSVHDLESLFLVLKMCDSEREEKQRGSDGKAAVTTPEEENDAVTVEVVRETRMQSLSLVTDCYDVFGRESGTSADFLGEVGLLIDPMGQAQYLICTPPQFTNRKWVLQQIKGRGSVRKTKAVWELEDLDLTFNPMGQAHKFIITPPIFTNSAGVLQLEGGLNKQEDQLFNITSLFSKSLDWPIIVEEEGRSPNIVSSFIEVEALRREATILYDPGGRFSSSCITWSSCFKFWDPRGRLLMACFRYLHLEDKVNV